MKYNMASLVCALILAAIGFTASQAHADKAAPYEITIVLENHVFQPSVLSLPAGQKLSLTIINNDNTEEEFDSDDLGREVWLKPNGRSRVYLGPLQPGHYGFQGERHAASAHGVLNVQ